MLCQVKYGHPEFGPSFTEVRRFRTLDDARDHIDSLENKLRELCDNPKIVVQLLGEESREPEIKLPRAIVSSAVARRDVGD